jgi:two-component system, NarL family, response regulator DevR
MQPIRVMLVDDHEMVRQGLCFMLKDDVEVRLVGEAADGQHALDLVVKVKPEVMLVDISMPRIDGIDLCRRVKTQFPSIAIIMLTTFGERHLLEECMKAGARGYILKDVEHSRLLEIIKAVARGESIVDQKILGQLTFKAVAAGQFVEEQGKIHCTLSDQQVTILKLISNGLSNKEIGFKLSLSENTVKSYIQDLLHVLSAKNRAEAAMIALRNKWIA